MSLEILLNNRANEFREIADAVGIRTDKPNWKNTVLQFSLQFHNCLKGWGDDHEVNNDEIHQCHNIMRQISRKKGISKMLQLLYVINKIAEDFQTISKGE